MIGDGATGVDEVVDVIEGIKIPNGGDAVLLEHFGMQIDDVPRLGIEGDHVDATGKGLEVCIGSGLFTEGVHHVEGTFVTIKEEALETGPASSFEVSNACISCGFHSGHEVRSQNSGSISTLKTITESRDHDINFFGHGFLSGKVTCL